MTLLLFLTGLSTIASSSPTPPSSAGGLRFEVGGNTVQALFPISTVISSYAAITFPTNLGGGGSGGTAPLDGLTPSAAFSPSRQLLTSYSGAFYSSGTVGIQTLNDQSGHGRNLSAGSSAFSQPIPSSLGMNFDGSNNFLTSSAPASDFFDVASGYIVMSANITGATNDPTPADNSPLLETSTKQFGFTATDDGFGTTYALGINGTDTQYGFIPFTFPVVIECRHEGGELFVRVNAGAEFPIPTSDSVLTGVLNMGGRSGGPYVTATIYETATFSTVPASSARDAIVLSFGQYIGLFP